MKQSIKKYFSPKFRRLVTCGLMVLSILMDLAIMSCDVAETYSSTDIYSSIWSAAIPSSGSHGMLTIACIVALCLLLGAMIVSVFGLVNTLMQKQILIYPYAIGLCAHILLLISSNLFRLYGFAGGLWIILQIILNFAGLIYGICCLMVSGAQKKGNAEILSGSIRRKFMMILATLSQFVVPILFFTPLISYATGDERYRVVPVGLFVDQINVMQNLITFIALFVFCSISLVCYLSSFKRYTSEAWEYADQVQKVLLLNTVGTGVYYLIGLVWASVRNSKGNDYSAECYLPFLLMILLTLTFAFVLRGVHYAPMGLKEKTAAGTRIEFYLYGLIMAFVSIAACCSDVLQVSFPKVSMFKTVKLNGWKIISSMSEAEAGFQLVAFLLLAVMAITVALLILSTVSLISKSKLFYKLTLAQLITGVVSTMLIGLFGKYYEIVQKMNQEVIEAWLGQIIENAELPIDYKIKSQAFYWFVCAIVIAVVVLVRRPYTRGMTAEEKMDGALAVEEKKLESNKLPEPEKVVPGMQDSDPCPTFTELDFKIPHYQEEQKIVSAQAFEAPTLPGLVQFVVNYARDSRLHLYYTPQDIAAYIAGLGACRLTILQGMSGTGKTSLPKIFAEAVLGNCELVEVESSWRDKNELLGYYNEFSRIYTPKKFTQALYKAALNPDRMTFIVLDEMNLSRVEYYFSDFLSLMEHEEDKRAIKLLNIGLYRTAGGNRHPYFALSEGHTLRVPSNVWFVGTANRDESTFEISDKVYDRAHTMNFNRRAPKSTYQHAAIPQRYLSANELQRLFAEAKANVHFDIDSSAVVREVEELLAPYNISFGNRVANQIETFVSIYTSCFAPSESITNEALETILLSKVVSKLEYKSVDDKEELAAEFARLNLHRCSEFIRHLHED